MIDRPDAAATRRPLAEASPLPGRYYREPAIFAAEQERIFGRMWLAVARAGELAAPGDLVVRQAAGESLLIARGDDGEPRAFYNVCRHRGTRLIDEQEGECDGTADRAHPAGPNHETGTVHRVGKGIRCPYHSWTYGADGCLLAAPLMDETPGFRRDDYPLVPVALESWHGFLFVHLGGPQEGAAATGGAGPSGPPPLADQLADLPDLSRFRLGELTIAASRDYRVAANWKLLGENFGECYHCRLVHPQLDRISNYRSGGAQETGAGFTGGPMRLNPGFNTMSISGVTGRPTLPGLPPEDEDKVYYYCIYPGFFLSLHRDYVLSHQLTPLAPDRTAIRCWWLFDRQEVEAPGFDASDAVEFWDLTNRQDWAICERTQRGVTSRGYRPGRFQAGEGCVHAFDNWYLEALGEVG